MTPRRLVTRFCEEVWNRVDLSAIPELFHRDCTLSGSFGAERRGHAGLADYLHEVAGALGGCRSEIVALVVEEERAFARMQFSGRHTGPFLGLPPSGREVGWAGAALFECEGGRIRSLWLLDDHAGLRAQLVPELEAG